MPPAGGGAEAVRHSVRKAINLGGRSYLGRCLGQPLFFYAVHLHAHRSRLAGATVVIDLKPFEVDVAEDHVARPPDAAKLLLYQLDDGLRTLFVED